MQLIKEGQEIIYNLLNEGVLSEKNNKPLLVKYFDNDELRNVVDTLAEGLQSKIYPIADKVYLVPNIDNEYIGFNYRKENLIGDTLLDSYLSYLIMTIIFAEFTNEISPAQYIEVFELLDLVTESLERMHKNLEQDEELDVKTEVDIKGIYELWVSKPKWNESSKKAEQTTSADFQIGVIRKVIMFLEKENLINLIKDENKIVTTDKFIELMNGYFLDEARKEIIENLFKSTEVQESGEN